MKNPKETRTGWRIVALVLALAVEVAAQNPKPPATPGETNAKTNHVEAEKLLLLLKQKSRWSLGPQALLFADDDTEVSGGFVSSVQIRNYSMSAQEVALLGEPAAQGIPNPPTNHTAVQWRFINNLKSTDQRSELKAKACRPADTPVAEFVQEKVGGVLTPVLRFSAGTYFQFDSPLKDAKGSPWLADYTVIMDVMFPNMPSGWAALWQTDPENKSDAEWFISERRGIGVTEGYGQRVPNGEWHRLALVMKGSEGSYTSYVNGQKAQQKGMDLRDELFNRTRDEDVAEWATLMTRLIALKDPTLKAEVDGFSARLHQAGGGGIAPPGQRLPAGLVFQLANPGGVISEIGENTPNNQYETTPTKELVSSVIAKSRWVLGSKAWLFADESSENAGGWVNALQLRNYAMSDEEVRALGAAAEAMPLPAGLGSGSVRVAQWDFNGTLDSSSGGPPLLPRNCQPAVQPDWEFVPFAEAADKPGAVRFGRGTCFEVQTELSDDPESERLLNYSVVMDVKFTERPVGWVSLWQNDFSNRSDADWFIDKKKQLGIRDLYGGLAEDGTWNRLALVVDGEKGIITHYINGAKVRTKLMIMEDEIRMRGGCESDLSGLVALLDELRRREGAEAAAIVALFNRRMHNTPDTELIRNTVPMIVEVVEEDQPIAQASVEHRLAPRMENFFPETHTCNKDGRVEIKIPIPVPSYIRLTATAPGFVSQTTMVNSQGVLSSPPMVQKITLKKSLALGGVVVDQDDRPVARVNIMVVPEGGEASAAPFVARTSENGSWKLSGVSADIKELTVILKHPSGTRINAKVKRGDEAWNKLIKGEAVLRVRRDN